MEDPGELRRRVLEAVTDGALAELEFDKLVDVLLGRVRELFAVDTVTVLLLGPAGEQLVATSALGLEEEVYQGVRVPVGVGFAGRIAARREPMALEEVNASTVVNPLLAERGLRTLLGAPMIAGGQLTGVLHIGCTAARRFTDAEVESLQLVADRLALAALAYRSRSERAATTLLQDSLLPSRLPAVPGWELAARYVPGTEAGVGGDWYDVLPLSDRRFGLVIGDVVGNGLAAAVVMGRLRSALRAYALEFPDPADVLGKLDRKASHFERNTMATVGYAVIDMATSTMRVALAGHLPPVIALPGRPAVLAEVPLGPPVGRALAIHGRRSGTVELPPGALVALFTDGLVERRDSTIDDGLARLLSTVDDRGDDEPAESVGAHIMATMVGAHAAADDIALLTARHTAG
ncbi:MAG: PP2C family protein-serine/threonine phosphatase [Actinophytocola sp.]|uniref:PP2C family protein-serine/threonine phosphatase n=1 Tax=Actinophytocola sp. TaxID=1872138 RepID=UPI003D6A313E